MNRLKTTLLLALLSGLLVFAGAAIGGRSGATFALFMAFIMNFVAYWFSDKIVLAMYRARQVTEADAPVLHRIVRQLATMAQIPMPKVYIMENPAPNAFATGRNPSHAAVAVTTGILNLLNEEELRGVIAHELSHVKHRDILVSTIAATIGGAISHLAYMAQWGMMFGRDRDERDGSPLGAILMIVIAPLAAMLIQLAISRSREYLADEGGARLAGSPLALANALRKLHQGSQVVPMEANPSTAHMFIVSPLTGGGFLKLFSTHPPIEERIARLEAMVYKR
ncbi:MAG: zinc metalloprotease HtpX [Nitrospirota bacterium]